MSIANGFSVEAADLNATGQIPLGRAQADNAQLPLGHEYVATFQNLVGGGSPTPVNRSKAVFVVPYDCFVESLAVVANDMTNGASLTVALSCPGVLDAFPVAVTTTLVSGALKVSRFLFDNSKANATAGYMSANPALRLLPKGATVTVNTSTTSTATPSSVQVTLVLRSYFNRG